MSNSDMPLFARIMGRIREFFGDTGTVHNTPPAQEEEAAPSPAVTDHDAEPQIMLAPPPADAPMAEDEAPDSPAAGAGMNEAPVVIAEPEIPASEPALEMDAAPVPEVLAAVEALEEAVADETVTETAPAVPTKTRKPRTRKPAATAVPVEQPAKPTRKSRAKKAPAAEAPPVEAAPSPAARSAARKPRAKPATRPATKPASEKPKAPRKPRAKPTA